MPKNVRLVHHSAAGPRDSGGIALHARCALLGPISLGTVRVWTDEKRRTRSETDIDDLMQALWHNNELSVEDERIQIQMTFGFLLHAYSGARGGTFIEAE